MPRLVYCDRCGHGATASHFEVTINPCAHIRSDEHDPISLDLCQDCYDSIFKFHLDALRRMKDKESTQ